MVLAKSSIMTYEDCLKWIENKKTYIDDCRYGCNKDSLLTGLKEQQGLAEEIEKYSMELNSTLARVFDKEKQQNLQKSYDDLKDASERKVNCIKSMLEICSLEEKCSRLSRDMDLTSVSLVHPEDREKCARDGGNILGFISPSTQDCLFAVKDNWQWIVKLVSCIDVHLKNGSNYHQFFHELDQISPCMIHDLEKIQKRFESVPLRSDPSDTQLLMKEMEDILTVLKQWEVKTDTLWSKANQIVPVHLRTEAVTQHLPAKALCDYSSPQISVRDGEDLLLIDNSDPYLWRVKTCRGKEGDIPALCVLIPGPYQVAIDGAVKLRLQLLTEWTNAIKRLGKRLLCYMLLIFKPDYQPEEIKALRSIKRIDKQELLRILDYVEDTLNKHWSDHEGFINLQERILALRMILEEVGEQGIQDDKVMQALILQITSLEKLMNQYKDIYGNWEMFKTSLEASQNPDLMLIVDKWQQLQFVTRDFFSKFWKNQLPMEKEEKSIMTLKTMTLQGEKLEDPISGHAELINNDFSWEEVTSTSSGTDRELSRAKKVDIQDALGSAESRTIEIRTALETDRQADRPTHRSRVINIEHALGTGDHVTDLSGWKEETVQETVIQTERALNRSRQVDIRTALGGESGSEDSGFTETRVVQTSAITEDAGRRGRGREIQTIRVASVNKNGALHESEEVFEEGMFEEGVIDTHSQFEKQATASQTETEGVDFGYATMIRTAETEQIQSAELEEKKTFIIRSVVNPYDNTDISLQQAIVEGFIRPTEGVYVNPRSGTAIPIPEAMSQGLIKVAFTTVSRSEERRSTLGIITVKTIREPLRPYVIKRVLDPRTGEWISEQQASKEEILFVSRGIYHNRKTGERMLIAEAIEKKLVEVDYVGDAPEPEVISNTYAVRSVVDLRLKKVITFGEAVRRGIIDKESGTYRNTLTGETMYVGDAIIRGFLKARKIDRTASLDIDPENRILVDKTEAIRKKVLQPLKVISAFRRATKMAQKDHHPM